MSDYYRDERIIQEALLKTNTYEILKERGSIFSEIYEKCVKFGLIMPDIDGIREFEADALEKGHTIEIKGLFECEPFGIADTVKSMLNKNEDRNCMLLASGNIKNETYIEIMQVGVPADYLGMIIFGVAADKTEQKISLVCVVY